MTMESTHTSTIDPLRCKSCSAPLRFALTEYGKAMPLDREPILVGGAYEIGNDGVARFVPVAARAGKGPLYQPHFASCSNPDAHRKPRKRK